MATGFATVKEVLSGDTVVLVGQPKNGPPPEIRLTLASLQAPRLGNSGKGGETKDEPFAWASREFLRQTCIGKHVSFKVEYTVPSINRQFGAVHLTTGSKENLCVVVAREGWARVKSEGDDKERSGDYDAMALAGAEAEAQGRGIFNKDPAAVASAVRNITFEVADAAGLLKKVKGLPQRAVIEYVRDGSSFKVLLLEHMTFLSFNLAGVQTPRLNAGNGNDNPEPFAREAKYFTEIRLLNRDVNVVINGIDDRFKTFYGSIEHPAGDIAVELVKNGLARAVDWSMNYTSLQHAAAMRAAAREAKEGRLRIWRNYEPPTISGDSSYEGVASEIVSGDTLVIRVGSPELLASRPWDCEERRISLSSIRAPRLGARSRNEPDAPFAREARELLRSRILGKKCDVTVEYERAPAAGASGFAAAPRVFATVMAHTRKGRKNAAVMLVEAGFADVIRHRADDERSAHYDELQAALVAAKQAGAGMHAPDAPKEPSERRIVDLTANAAQARASLSSLQQQKPGARTAGQHKGVVEFVINASRMRVFLPGENTLLNFALGGIVTPSTARSANKGRAATPAEPFSAEALAFTKSLAMQRDVTVEIEAMDKGGTAIGQCFVKRGSDTVNLGVALLEAGLASVNDFTVRFTPNGDELQREQAEARRKRVGMWHNYVKPEPGSEEAAAESSGTEGTVACVSEIVNGSVFFIQNQSAASLAKLEAIEKAMAAIGEECGTTPGAAGTGIAEPKKNMNVLALFDDGTGNKWFRAKILAIQAGKDETLFTVRYIDYGNEETVKMDRLRAPSSDAVFANPASALECQLAFVKVPALDKDFGREAAMALSDLVFGKKVNVVQHGKSDSGRLLVSLFTVPEAKEGEEVKSENIAYIMLRDGLGYVDSKGVRYFRGNDEKKAIASLKEAQEQAHAEHVNLWRYGDPREEDE